MMPVLPTRRYVMVGAAAMVAVSISRPLHANTSKHHEVKIRSFAYDPAVIQVRVGDTIRWTNKDIAPHTATADGFGWDTGTLERNQTAEVEVTASMELSYFCVFHPHMKGKVVIVD